VIFVDAVDVRSRLTARLQDSETVIDEIFGLLSKCQVGVGKAERSYVPLAKCLTLGRAPADPVVLAKNGPVILCSESNPLVILHILRRLFTVDLSQRPDDQADLTQRGRERKSTETAVNEELRRLVAAALPTG
jgi:hypothetical protein